MAGAGVAKVGVLGAGAFGTALANVAARAGAAVTLWPAMRPSWRR